MAVGYGNTARTFEQFRSLAASDPRIHRNALVLVNAAAPRLDATQWEAPWSIAHARVATEVLPSAGLTAAQVQVAWIQLITEFPYTPLGIQIADAYYLKSSIAGTLIALKNRFPNLQIAYLSSSEFGGYGTSKYNPEPFAYEGGLSVRWVLLAQIDYARQGYTLEPRMVDINYEDAKAPWARWGPYLWADGATPRSDGLTWQREDFEADGETLSPIGARKSAQELLRFLLAEPTAAHWFRRDDVPARRRAARR